jgi:hypothetical protein
MPVIAAVIATIIGSIIVFVIVNSPPFEAWFCDHFSSSKICAQAEPEQAASAPTPTRPLGPAMPEGTVIEPPFAGREPGASRDQ